MQGAFLVLTVTVVTTNLLVDLLYRRLDPRTADVKALARALPALAHAAGRAGHGGGVRR